MAPHSSALAWKIPWTEEPGRLQSMGSLRVGQDWAIHFHFSLSCIGEGNGNPLPCSCLENPRDGGAWWAAVYGVAQSQTRLKGLSSSSSSRNDLLSECFLFISVSISSNPYLLPRVVLWVISDSSALERSKINCLLLKDCSGQRKGLDVFLPNINTFLYGKARLKKQRRVSSAKQNHHEHCGLKNLLQGLHFTQLWKLGNLWRMLLLHLPEVTMEQ